MLPTFLFYVLRQYSVVIQEVFFLQFKEHCERLAETFVDLIWSDFDSILKRSELAIFSINSGAYL